MILRKQIGSDLELWPEIRDHNTSNVPEEPGGVSGGGAGVQRGPDPGEGRALPRHLAGDALGLLRGGRGHGAAEGVPRGLGAHGHRVRRVLPLGCNSIDILGTS